MKQLVVLSGKGGTGKTTIASALIRLFQARAYADCDVDAPNLHLIHKFQVQPKISDYYGLPKAEIQQDLCTRCDLCRQYCRFDAIYYRGEYRIDNYSCEGCGLCEVVCPTGAITLNPALAGSLMLYQNEAVFSTAQLKMGSGTSGLLVTEVKKRLITSTDNQSIAIIDGSPGIGCPVIASISGADMVLIVTEPSISGLKDMERIIKTAKSFHVDLAVCINKYDTNPKITEKIEEYCQKNNLPFLGKVPFDPVAVKAVNNGNSIIDIECSAGEAVRKVYKELKTLL